MMKDNARVIFPPPLIFLGALLLGFGLNWGLSLPRRPEPPWSFALGAPLVVLALLLGVSAIRVLRAARTNVNPYKPSTAVVTSGPYRWTRNPIYTAMVLLYLGLALLLGALGPLMLLVPVLAMVRFGVIAREELYLSQRFGEEYRSYAARVRRWV
jgi:protein-S-isoprenylcysteine O-methyltransferase Ste14